MTEFAQIACEQLIKNLIQMPLNHVWRGHGSALFLEFGLLEPVLLRNGKQGHPRGEMSVHPGTDWRFEQAGRVVCAAYGNEDHWHKTWASLIGQRLVAIDIGNSIPDLTLSFENGTRLRSFVLTEEPPAWTLTDHRQKPELWISWRQGALFADDGKTPPD
ncbi:hypothetical protein ACFSM5_08770 [Lacibacterium aquatile]|uniref:Uncharacterized protein n=1 Tax=Lacibacterium aquatile TaxID=1168082 RepID=A0ABW5DPP7_9PROT